MFSFSHGFGVLAPSWKARVADIRDVFCTWWREQLQQQLGVHAWSWLMGPERRVLQYRAADDLVELTLSGAEDGALARTRVPQASLTEAIDRILAAHQLARTDVDHALVLPTEAFFARRLLLPSEVLSRVHEIAERDIAAKLPFRIGDIYHRTIVEKSPDPKRLIASQWIIKREIVENEATRLQLRLDDLSYVHGPSTAANTPSPLIALGHDRHAAMPWYWASVRSLVISGLVLATLAIGLKIWHQQQTLDDLDAQIAASRDRARTVRQKLDGLELKQAAVMRVHLDKASMPGLLDLLNETTTILPAHSWLSEFQLVQLAGSKLEQQLLLTGFSEAAAGLVREFDRSPMFRETALTSPISTDAAEGRERFSLQVKLNRLDSVRESPR
ncbi:PilN domain-containing protein [Bradyrhizobium sp. WD16]|uniref:PilN domain-containing protein n=1 Tax=Bradyrhizobium sp. WD16 TaxID=1521768 RepID=UPI0020A57D9E|nr:PilN domain-containing protein [Bradyrhizobium sp. WD16]UTD29049.1 hypothetical protein DB459_21260 [Bradyrhizobium sp. WD16]